MATLNPTGPVSRPSQRQAHGQTRSRRGCLTCRTRKVKCDEQNGKCLNCGRLNLNCAWQDHSNSSQRSRSNVACQRCRGKKIRCLVALQGDGCQSCQHAAVVCRSPCSNIPYRQPSKSPSASSSSSVPQDTLHPPALADSNRAEDLRLIDAYFAGPHNFCFYTIIHQPTFMQMLDNDLIPRPLLLIILATSQHYSDPTNPISDNWADECRQLIMVDIFASPSMMTLQTLLLLQRYEWHRSSHMSAWLISALAIRVAHALQLNLEIPNERNGVVVNVPTTVRETRRRLIWSCFVMESYIEAGRSPLGALNVSSIEAKLPCDDYSFQLGLATEMPTLDAVGRSNHDLGSHAPVQARLGIPAFYIRVAALRKKILQYTFLYHPRNQGHIPPHAPWEPESLFFQYRRELKECEAELPDDLRFNLDVLYRRRSELISFVAFHCTLHASYCDLFRIGPSVTASCHNDPSLTSPPGEFLEYCRTHRLRHAYALANVISESIPHHKAEFDPIVAICACLALRVIAIERRGGDNDTGDVSEEIMAKYIDALVQCARRTAQFSKPIRRLVIAIFDLAHLPTDMLNTPDASIAIASNSPHDPPSPSLRTYGTFGSIQDSLATQNDSFTPAAASASETQSDLFVRRQSSNYVQGPVPYGIDPDSQHQTGKLDSSPIASYNLSYDRLSPHALQVASGWVDGTLDFLATQDQFSLGVENPSVVPDLDWAYEALEPGTWGF